MNPWQAVYVDGSTFEGPYHEIERPRLRAFIVRHGGLQTLREVPPTRRLVWRRRTQVRQGGGMRVLQLLVFEPASTDYDARMLDSYGYVFDEEHVTEFLGYRTDVPECYPPVLQECEL